MTIAETHDLKNSGAHNAKIYFDGIFGENSTPYPAVFVVPVEIEQTYKVQSFKGNVGKKPHDMASFFDQWVIGV